MSMLSTPEILRLATIDDYLGAADGRFFGTGYRRVSHRFHDERAEETAALTARCSIDCPSDWSRKGSFDQRPHLSTIDVLVIAAQFAELLLLRTFALTDEDRARMWVRKVLIRAGSAPVEDSLDDLPVTAKIRQTQSDEGSDAVTGVSVSVASLAVRLEIVHPGERCESRTPVGSMSDLLGASDRRGYGDGFRNQRVEIRDVVIDRVGTTAAATSWVSDVSEREGRLGMEALYQPSVSLVSAFVEALQLGQVLLYELDGVERARSSTLWMRRTVLEVATPYRSIESPGQVTVGLGVAQSLTRGGERWRVADIVSTRPGIKTMCSVAHRLGDSGISVQEPS